ncbi:MAG: cytidine deaminase [Coriobacteriia bacterium]|nr:MAG: cytidine deaminase [Coriobacteriia bacterium]HJJ00345.1 cytidine/deoxycytidylate deaminase family protein [Coriobacteriaceae bacterium]
MADTRPSWDEYFMDITKRVATRSTCLRRAVGAILVHDKRIIASGYNGGPTGLAHCLDIGCLREKLGIPSGQQHELCRGIHAEQNAIIQAARYGVSIEGATLYCTTQPCTQCTKMLINAGITEIVYAEGYPDDLARELLDESGIVVRRFED